MECLVCDKNKGFNHYKVREMMFGTFEEFDYLECHNCGCLQLKNIPCDMSKYYRGDYYSFNKEENRKFFIKNILINIRNRYLINNRGFFGKILNTFFPNVKLEFISFVKLSCNSKILDVGCGNGWFLHALKEAGMKNVLGVDPYIEKTINYKNGLRILKANLADIEGKWNLVMFNHSLEHFPNPIQTLKKVARLLVDGGSCLISIPTVSSYAWQHYRENWVQIDSPRHIFLPSIKSIEIMANISGFELNKYFYDSNEFQFWGSEQYKKGISLTDDKSYSTDKNTSIFSKAEIKSFRKMSNELNINNNGDQAVFILKKK